MRADLVALGVRLGWVAADEKEEPALAAVRERLRHEGEGLLLIYDNAIDAESLRPYLPPGGAARVLVTSNAHAWRGVAAPVEIRLWPKEIGADYLIVRTGREKERADAEALSEALGGLPLAHEQAAAYCDRLEVSFAEYRKRFDAAPARLLDAAKDAPSEYHDGLTVAKTFALAIEEAAKLHPAAEPLIVHAALLAPEPIPLFLFSEGAREIRRAAGHAARGRRARRGAGGAAGIRPGRSRDDRGPARSVDRDGDDSAAPAGAGQWRRCGGRRGRPRRAGGFLLRRWRRSIRATVFDDPSAWPRARRLDALASVWSAGQATPRAALK